MPNYTFKHPNKEEYEEVFFHMNDEPKSFSKDGTEWNRIFISPNLSTAGNIDPWNNNDFVNKTKEKKGTYGDLLDQSAELSAKRAEERGGVDPLKQKAYDDYAETRKGQRHPQEVKEKGYESKNVKVEYE